MYAPSSGGTIPPDRKRTWSTLQKRKEVGRSLPPFTTWGERALPRDPLRTKRYSHQETSTRFTEFD